MTAHGRREARLRAPAGARAVPRLAGRAPAGCRAGAGGEQRRGRAPRARRARHRGDRRPGGRGDLRPDAACDRDRGPRRTTPRGFWSSGASCSRASGADKTTLLVSRGDTDDSGALLPPARAAWPSTSVSMTRIESRPSRKRKWDYVFFIDIEGHVGDPAVAAGAGGAAEARLAVQGARLLPAGRTLSEQLPGRIRVTARVVRGTDRRSRRQVDLASLADALGHRGGHERRQRLSGERGLPGEPARRCARSGVRIERPAATRVHRARRRPARPEAGAARARHGQRRHGDAPVHGPAVGAGISTRS